MENEEIKESEEKKTTKKRATRTIKKVDGDKKTTGRTSSSRKKKDTDTSDVKKTVRKKAVKKDIDDKKYDINEPASFAKKSDEAFEEVKKVEKVVVKDDTSFSMLEVCLVILCTSVISIIVGIALNNHFVGGKNKYSESLNELITNYKYIVDSYYGELDEDRLVDAAINGIINELGDNYSSYFSESEADNFDKVLDGSYEGIGVQIGQYVTGDIVVVSVFEGSSADEAGLKIYDIIKSIDGKSLEGMTTTEVVETIKVSSNPNFVIKVLRGEEELEITVVRKKVVIKSVEYTTYEKNNKKIGYIYVNLFSLNTYDQFKEALEALEGSIDSLVVDVRDNSGGHLTSAEQILSLFLDSTNLIYKMEINGNITSYYSKGKVTKTYPVAVLMNGSSASASELFALAMKERYGAILVGTTSFGKGTVQEKITLSTGASYKVTTKKWLSSNDVWLNGIGITPDVAVGIDKNWLTLSPEDDVQLQTALTEISVR